MTRVMFINCYCMVEIGILKQLQGRISAFLIRYYFIIIQNVSVICFYFVFMHNFINKTCILLLADTSAWFVNYLQVVGWSLIYIFVYITSVLLPFIFVCQLCVQIMANLNLCPNNCKLITLIIH